MNRKYVVLAAMLLIVLIFVALFLTVNNSIKQTSTKPFYVGVEFAYGNQFRQLKALVDEVKSYTNLIIVGLDLTYNQALLNKSCDYIFNSGLNFIVFFTTFAFYNATNGWVNYTIFDWILSAEQKYGSKFLGFYRFDEPGGNQLDSGDSQLISNMPAFSYPDSPAGYAEVSQDYVGNLSSIVQYYLGHTDYTTKEFTSDFGLFWFDYEAGYSTVFGEFVGNESRQLAVALDRGAAQSFSRDWGVIILGSMIRRLILNPELKCTVTYRMLIVQAPNTS